MLKQLRLPTLAQIDDLIRQAEETGPKLCRFLRPGIAKRNQSKRGKPAAVKNP